MRKERSLKTRIVPELYRDAKTGMELCTEDTKEDTLAYKIVHMGKELKDDKWGIRQTIFGVRVECKTTMAILRAYFSYQEWDIIQMNIQTLYATAPPYGILDLIKKEVAQEFIDVEMDMVILKDRMDNAKLTI